MMNSSILEVQSKQVIKGGIYLLVFILPILFTATAADPFELTKQSVLVVGGLVLVLLWMVAQIFFTNSIRIRSIPLHIPVILFLFVAVLSAVFSVNVGASLGGGWRYEYCCVVESRGSVYGSCEY